MLSIRLLATCAALLVAACSSSATEPTPGGSGGSAGSDGSAGAGGGAGSDGSAGDGDAAAIDGAAEAEAAAPATLGAITPQELSAALLAKDFLLVNVHVPDVGQIAGTDSHIAYTDVDGIAAFVGADLDRKVVVYCLGEGMSVPAGQALVARGYRAVRYLVGGMNGWTAAGYPLE